MSRCRKGLAGFVDYPFSALSSFPRHPQIPRLLTSHLSHPSSFAPVGFSIDSHPQDNLAIGLSRIQHPVRLMNIREIEDIGRFTDPIPFLDMLYNLLQRHI